MFDRRYVVGLFVLALWLAPGTGAAGTPTCDPGKRLRQREDAVSAASACYLADRLADAIAIQRHWLERSPNDRAMRVELARLLSESGDLAGAEAEYDRLLAGTGVERERRALRRARADVRAWRGVLEPAIAEYRALLAEQPGDASAALALGLALQWSGKPLEAESALQGAVDADPSSVEAVRALAALRSSPAYLAGRAEAERLEHPEDASRWVTAADALAEAEQFSNAESVLSTARQRWPTDRRFRVRESAIRDVRHRRNAQQIENARAALAANDDDGAARLSLAAALADEGDTKAAVALYDEHLRRHPDDRATRRQAARVLSWAGDYGPALARYDALVASTPDDLDLRLERGRVLAWDGQLTESAREVAAARGTAPALAERTLGDVYRWGGARGAATRHYRGAIALGDGDENAQGAAEYFATESDVFDALPAFNVVQDSADFTAVRATVEARQRLGVTTDLGAGLTHAEYDQHGDHLRAERARFTLTTEWDDRWRTALTWIPSVYDDHRTSHGGGVELTRVFGPESQLSVGYDRYDLIDEVMTIASADRDVLDANRVRIQGRHVLPARIELAGSASFADYSDGNRLFAMHMSVARRLLRRPGLTLRYEGGYLDYARQSDVYWDPDRYVTSGVALVMRQPLAKRVALQLEARVGYGNDDGRSALERSFGASVAIAEVAGVTAEVGYRYGETGRVDSPGVGSGTGYSVHSGMLSLRYRFGKT